MNRVFWLQVFTMTLSNMKARYRNTAAGMMWVILGPLVVYGVQSFVFTKVLWINVPNYSRFLMSGLLSWIFIQQSVDSCTALFVNYGRLLTSFTISPVVLLVAQILDNFINFILAFLLLLIPTLIFTKADISLVGILLMPIPIFILIIGTIGLCWIFATINVFYRDTRFVLAFAMSIAYYVTPIFYPIDFVPPEYRWLVGLNPLYRLIDPFRIVIYGFEHAKFWTAVMNGLTISMMLHLFAFALWRRKKNEIYFQL
jgi:lipopolysaccharide transport system permease protein